MFYFIVDFLGLSFKSIIFLLATRTVKQENEILSGLNSGVISSFIYLQFTSKTNYKELPG